eukprot:gene8047-1281_t
MVPTTRLTIFRGGNIEDVDLRLGTEDGIGTNRIVHWCGAQLQAPHRAVKERGFLPQTSGVFISRWHHGSPAHRYGLYALHFIIEVNNIPTPTMDAFLDVVHPLKDGEFDGFEVLAVLGAAAGPSHMRLEPTQHQLASDPASRVGETLSYVTRT